MEIVVSFMYVAFHSRQIYMIFLKICLSIVEFIIQVKRLALSFSSIYLQLFGSDIVWSTGGSKAGAQLARWSPGGGLALVRNPMLPLKI